MKGLAMLLQQFGIAVFILGLVLAFAMDGHTGFFVGAIGLVSFVVGYGIRKSTE